MEHTVTIPSKGFLNNFSGAIQIKEMTIDSELEILSNHAPIEKIINMVQHCVVDPKSLVVAELPIIDIMYLLFEVRALSLDKEYNYPVQCDSCGVQFRHNVILPDDISVKRADSPVVEPFEVNLPSGDKIHIKYLRGNDQVEIEGKIKTILKSARRQDKEGNMADNVRKLGHILRIAKQIVKINGKEVGLTDSQTYVQKMTIKDSTALREAMEMGQFGVDTEIEIVCPSCGNDFTTVVQMRPEFFRPSKRGFGGV